MEEEPGYVLVRGMHASIRLNLQHYLWKDGLGYLLHPSIPPPPLETKYRIADLGTGTGIWPLDLARQLPPTVQVYGFDISPAQFPHPSYLPSNVKLQVLNSLQVDPPEELLESFDIVHLRLWLGVVMNGDPSAILSHALKLLRPGGYIQWNEIDPNRGIAEGPNGEESPHAVKILIVQANIKDHRWIPALPKLFEQYNLEDIKEDFAFEQPWQTKMAGDCSCAVVHEMANNGSPFIVKSLERVGVDVPKAYEEVGGGARLTQPFCVTVGRKPMKKTV
ncbi:uncharacterized protein EAF01_000594 [Botrytis porri]|uniref:Methyltransferase domain-containing protein n=1 Tax=Botrytis porri TaxID=87229 RepID=A0A4Z1KAA3_9HELO|nr:uncharacterized protein EAF01_000594 [Botrytis porri]KAF7914188.1 hypothetical protein EAF01_000594 [Botrytis porri]TGO83053.1 hypothetical protein BPOR_0710g00030 [Botrytis porri]